MAKGMGVSVGRRVIMAGDALFGVLGCWWACCGRGWEQRGDAEPDGGLRQAWWVD